MANSTGRCLCGGIRWQARGVAKWTALCHCESCRRATSAPVVAWIGYEETAVTWRGARAFYGSSAGVKRGFCPTCGAPLSFQSSRWPTEIHLYAASLDAPETYAPKLHCHFGERLSWVTWQDDLPKYKATAGEDEESQSMSTTKLDTPK